MQHLTSMLAIVSYDAGGAEILSSYVRRERLDCLLVLDGPARSVFARKVALTRCVELEEAIAGASWILCGTGWQSDFEWRAIRAGRAAGKRTVAFLDHWINYQERFVHNGEECLPDEIWVGDEYARRIAQECFAKIPLRLVANPYFEDLREELNVCALHRPRASGPVVLYVCEPVREFAIRQHGDERFLGYVEEEALEYFLENISLVSPDIARILVRPHPSEPLNKYLWVRQRSAVPVEFSGGRTLTQDIAAADIVVGCESMAMVVGLLAGKRVLSSTPPGGRRGSLPQPGIESIAALAAAHQSHKGPPLGAKY